MGLFGKIFGKSITWYCDGCNCVMNDQPGFNTNTGSWECVECGEINDVSENNIYSSEESYQESMGIPRCPYCGGMVQGDAPDATYWFNCGNCSTRFYLEDGELIDVYDRSHSRTTAICSSCGQSLRGGEHVAAWENGNNPDAYTKCPHCGYVNFEWE